MKTIKGDLVLKENYSIDDDLTVDGNIICEGALWSLNCRDLNCRDLTCANLNCMNLNFYAICIAYESLKCKSWKATRDKHIIKCLDGEIEIKNDENTVINAELS